MFRCPVCGTRLNLADAIQLTPRQEAIRDAIVELRRDLGRMPYSIEISVKLNCSDRLIRYELTHMEYLKVVHRPAGERSGWALKRDSVALVLAA